MADIIHISTYELSQIDKKEVMRYAGAKEPSDELNSLIDSCISEIETNLTYKVCHTELPIRITDSGIDLGFTTVTSKNLRKNLENCGSVVLFGATIGIAIDRLIARYNRISPSRALIVQAIGAERIEALCDRFNAEITETMRTLGKSTRPRFSPGYGDLPLEFQREIFGILDCPRRIGLTLNDSMLMSPSKSVTAIIGIVSE